MSGHSKWSQIKRQKGVADAKRGQVFTKLAKIVTVAAKRGGGDPAMNPSLRVAIEQARAENMPKDNIDRAIKRGTGELGGAVIEELRYEVYGPAGVAIVIDAVTDNPNRTTAEVKATLNKHGGKLATAGAVAFQFRQQGIILLPIAGQKLSPDDLELMLIEAGAASYETQGDLVSVITELKDISHVKDELVRQGVVVTEVKLSFEPIQTVGVTDLGDAKQILRLVEALEDVEDVTSVTANFDISDELLASST